MEFFFCNIKNNYYLCIPHRGVEQLVARRAHNPEAGGSSPSPATKQAKKQSSDWFFAFIPAVYSVSKGLFILFIRIFD